MTRSRDPRVIFRVLAIFVPGVLALLGILVVGSGCASADYREAPEWISRPPVDDDYLYAVGSYVGSLDPNDDFKNALKDAARRLAASFKSKISSRTEIRTTNSSGTTSTHYKDVTEADTATVLSHMEHLYTWVDVDGSQGRRQTVWVLVRAPRELNL